MPDSHDALAGTLWDLNFDDDKEKNMEKMQYALSSYGREMNYCMFLGT